MRRENFRIIEHVEGDETWYTVKQWRPWFPVWLTWQHTYMQVPVTSAFATIEDAEREIQRRLTPHVSRVNA